MNKNSVIVSNRKRELMNVTLIGLVLNIFLMTLKLIIGITFNSSAMVADGIHSVEDMVSSFCSYIGIRLSIKSKNQRYPNGYEKVEYFISLIISIFMIFAAITMFKTSIENLIYKNIVNYNILLVIVCLITIISKIIVYMYTKKVYIKTNNILILALKEDHRNDIFVTTSVFIGVLVCKYNIGIIDSIMSIIISLWIGFTGIKILRKSYYILVDINLSTEKINKIKNVMYEFDEIKEIINIVGKPLGEKYLILIELKLNNDFNISYICDFRRKVKDVLINRFKYVHDVILVEYF